MRRRGRNFRPAACCAMRPRQGASESRFADSTSSFPLRVLLLYLFAGPLILFFLLTPKARIEAGLCATT